MQSYRRDFRAVAAPVVTALLLLVSTTAGGQTLYVKDSFEVTLRTGKSTSHSIVRMLPTGTPLEVIEADAEAGYTLVRLPGGTEGWVLTRMLMDRPPAREQLAEALQRIERLGSDNRALREQLATLTEVREALDAEIETLTQEGSQLGQELTAIRRTSANALNLARENQTIKSELAEVEANLAMVRSENAELRGHTTQRWFLIGAAVLGAGIAVGVLLPRLQRRRRSGRWNSL